MHLSETAERRERLYLILTCLFSVVIVVSNLITVKLVKLPFFSGQALPAGLMTFPLTFVLGDLVTELYGEKRARFMVYVGFAMSIVSFLIVHFAIRLPAHPEWVSTYNPAGYIDSYEYQGAYESVFGLNGLAIFSSLLAYGISQLLDVRIFAFLKELTQSRHLWLRNNLSTLIAQISDTLLVNTLVFYWGLKLDLSFVVQICISCYIYKAIFAICNTPLFYGAVNLARRYLNGGTVEDSARMLELKPEAEMG
jgi:uncharacterized integral membrane protein (TIGR00697 family)